jgi:hypothetical protein
MEYNHRLRFSRRCPEKSRPDFLLAVVVILAAGLAGFSAVTVRAAVTYPDNTTAVKRLQPVEIIPTAFRLR